VEKMSGIEIAKHK